MSSEDNRWMDPLLWELAVDLGGVPSGSSSAPGAQQPVHAAGDNTSPQNVAPGLSLPQTQATPFQQESFADQGTVLQQLHLSAAVAAALKQAQSLPATLEHSPLATSLGFAASFNSLSDNQLATAGANAAAASGLKGQAFRFLPAFGHAIAAPAASRQATSHSPSSSSGGQLPDEYTETIEHQRSKKPLNKGALAQKRFRERQKVSCPWPLPCSVLSGLPFSNVQQLSDAA